MQWQADSITFIFFYPPPKPHDAAALWTDVFGVTPPNYQRSEQSTSVASGKYEGFQVMLTARPGRVDLALTPGDGEMASRQPIIEDFNAAIKVLVPLSEKLCAGKAISRLALFTQFYSSATDSQTAISQLKDAARIDAPDGATDVTFAFNIPVTATEKNIVINRLCTWAAQQRQFVYFNIAVNNGQPGMGSPTIQSDFVVSFRTDVNTSPSLVSIDNSDVNHIIKCLFDETERLKSDGYDALVS